MSDLHVMTPDGSAGEPPSLGTGAVDDASGDSGPGEAAQMLPRPMISVASLTEHPGNVRRDLDLNDEFVASIEANGVLVPLRITPAADGAFRVIDGHRRLAAAVKAGLAEVPADLAGDRSADEAGQFLDMWTAHRHRNPLTTLEEADALFAAREAGATKTRIRKSTGLKPPEINAALAAARLSDGTRATVEELERDLTMEDLAVFAEFEDEPEAVAQLVNAARWHGSVDHVAERLRQERTDKAEHERMCRELEDAGYSITTALPPGGQLLTALRHDGGELTPESHVGCPGRGVFFRTYDPTEPAHYCADPASNGHTLGHDDPLAPTGAVGGDSEQVMVSTADPGAFDDARRLVVRGNKAWKAAAEVRKRWLAGNLFARRTASREISEFIARQLLTMPDPLRQGLASAHGRALFCEVTGQAADKYEQACGTAAVGRLPLLILAPIVAAYEQAMTEGEGKNTWRPDRYSPCPRGEAGRYLAFLASLGYQLSGIEQAVVEGVRYTGDTPPGDPLPESTDNDQQDADSTEQAAA